MVFFGGDWGGSIMTEGAFTGSGFKVGGTPRERPGERGTGSCNGGGRQGVEIVVRSRGLGGIGRLSDEDFAF